MLFVLLLLASFLSHNFSNAMPGTHTNKVKSACRYKSKKKEDKKEKLSFLRVCTEKNGNKLSKFMENKSVDIFVTDERQETAMHKAARVDFAEGIRLLRERGPSLVVARERMYGNMPLHVAAWYGYEASLQALKEHHTNLDVINAKRETPLMLATLQGHLRIVQMLLMAGARTSVKDEKGNTSLHLAAQKNHRDIAVFLLAHGASKGKLNHNKKTAAEVARDHNYDELALVIENFDRSKALAALTLSKSR